MTKISIPSKNISKLDLSNLNLKEIPSEVFELKNLRKLILSNNQITKIPKEITNLKRLETIDISNNKISEFFAKLCELKNLKAINLNNNRIASIPKQISNLNKLRKLSIANNKIKKFPQEFSKLDKLISLNISKNSFEELPNEIYSIKSIKNLWICNLNLKKININLLFENLVNLKSIYAFSNGNENLNLDADYNRLTKIKGNSFDELNKINSNKKNINESMMNDNNETKVKSTNKKKFFISYSKFDEDYKNEFIKHLITLKDDKLVEDFNCDEIDLGENSNELIQKKLNECDFMIALVSVDFLNTQYIRTFEVEKAKELGKKIIPIIIKPCDWENSIIKDFHAALRGTNISLNKELFLKDEFKESTEIERHAWWTKIIKEFRKKIFS